MLDLVGNPEDRFSHDEAQLCHGPEALLWQFVIRLAFSEKKKCLRNHSLNYSLDIIENKGK